MLQFAAEGHVGSSIHQLHTEFKQVAVSFLDTPIVAVIGEGTLCCLSAVATAWNFPQTIEYL